MVGLILPVCPVVGKSLLGSACQALAAGCSDGLAAAGVLVLGGDVADAGVQPGAVVLGPDGVELGAQHGRVGDGVQVRPLGLDGAVEGLDPGLGAPWKALMI